MPSAETRIFSSNYQGGIKPCICNLVPENKMLLPLAGSPEHTFFVESDIRISPEFV